MGTASHYVDFFHISSYEFTDIAQTQLQRCRGEVSSNLGCLLSEIFLCEIFESLEIFFEGASL